MPTESLFRLGVIGLDAARPGAALARVNTKAPPFGGAFYLFLFIVFACHCDKHKYED
jgi:hypothetical protein